MKTKLMTEIGEIEVQFTGRDRVWTRGEFHTRKLDFRGDLTYHLNKESKNGLPLRRDFSATYLRRINSDKEITCDQRSRIDVAVHDAITKYIEENPRVLILAEAEWIEMEAKRAEEKHQELCAEADKVYKEKMTLLGKYVAFCQTHNIKINREVENGQSGSVEGSTNRLAKQAS